MTKEPHNEKLDELLRQYMLDQDADSLPEDSVLNKSSEFVFNAPPLVTPPSAKEAEMLAKLKNAFPETQPSSNVASIRKLGKRWTWLAVAASICLLAIAAYTILPFGGTETKKLAVIEPQSVIDQEQLSSNDLSQEPSTLSIISTLANKNIDTPKNLGTLIPDPPGTDQVNNLAETGPGKEDPVTHRNRTNDRFPFQGPINPDPVTPPTPVTELFAQTTAPSQKFALSADHDHLVKAGSGTRVFVPSDAFVDASGKPVSGNVNLEVKEVYNKSDFVLSNLSTTSNGKLLESGGMIYIEATANGKQLQLAKGKEMQIEFASYRDLQSGWKLFTGDFNQNSSMNWTEVATPRKTMTPLPIEEINFKQFLSASNGHAQWDRYIEQLNDPRYENTYIATQEFAERLWIARNMDYMDWIVGYYMDNTAYALNKVDREIINSISGNSKNPAHQMQVMRGVDALKSLAQSGTNYIEHFDNRGVDLDGANAHAKLAAKGLSKSKVDKVMRLHADRNRIMAQINGPAQRKEVGNSLPGERGLFTHIRANKNSVWVWNEGLNQLPIEEQKMSFAVAHTGWLNLDRFSTPASSSHKVSVEISGTNAMESIKAFFVFEGSNCVIEGAFDADGRLQFAEIPSGSKGELVVISYENRTPSIARQQVLVNADLTKSVDLRQSTLEAFRTEIKSLDQI